MKILAKNEFKRSKSLKICRMTNEMLAEVSQIHMLAFRGAMNTWLGKSYLKKFFGLFVKTKGVIALVAILKSGEREEVVGYAIGCPPNSGKAIDRDLFWVACWNICIRPWLFLRTQVRTTIKARLKMILNSTPVQTSQLNLPDPVMSLVGLAVDPERQGENIGQELLHAFEAQARGLHSRSLKLSVYPENYSARRVYEKCDWVAFWDSITSGKAMFYYKIL